MGVGVELLRWLDIVVAIVVIIAALKSAYNGYVDKFIFSRLRRADEAHEQMEEVKGEIEDMNCKVDELVELSETQNEAIIAVGRAANGEQEFNAEAYKRDVDKRGSDQYLHENNDPAGRTRPNTDD